MKKFSFKKFIYSFIFLLFIIVCVLFTNQLLKKYYGLNFTLLYNLVKYKISSEKEIKILEEIKQDNIKSFNVQAIINNLDTPISLAFDSKNQLYIADEKASKVYIYNKKGLGIFLDDITNPKGLAIKQDYVYISAPGMIYEAKIDDVNNYKILNDKLPIGLNTTNDIVFGPDNSLYIAQGARSDHGESEIRADEGSILRMDTKSGKYSVIAKGLRNPIDIAFHPQTVEPLVGDQSFRIPYKNVPDELNIIFPNTNYGWPDCVGSKIGKNCDKSVYPLLILPKFSNISGLEFNFGDHFPTNFHHNLFIAVKGSPYAPKDDFSGILRVELLEKSGGYTTNIYEFASGFKGVSDIAFNQDGEMFVSDYEAGIIYKITVEYE